MTDFWHWDVIVQKFRRVLLILGKSYFLSLFGVRTFIRKVVSITFSLPVWVRVINWHSFIKYVSRSRSRISVESRVRFSLSPRSVWIAWVFCCGKVWVAWLLWKGLVWVAEVLNADVSVYMELLVAEVIGVCVL